MTRIIMRPMIEQIIYTKFSTSLSKVDKPVLGSLVSLAILPKTVRFPVAMTMAMHVPETQWDPCKPMHLVSRKFFSVDSISAANGTDSPMRQQLAKSYWKIKDYLPVRIERSNFASEETSTKRTSAGSLLPALTRSTSPGTISAARSVIWAPSRKT